VWNLGDGTVVSDVENLSHEYTSVGLIQVSLNVTDSTGISKTETQLINIIGTLPVAIFEATQRDGTLTVDFDASLSGSPNGEIVDYSWEFGDGDTANSAGPTITHTYSEDDRYFVRLTITDSTGATGVIINSVAVDL